MPAKVALSNNLVGCRVRMRPDFQSIKHNIWKLQPSLSNGEEYGEISAAWIQEGKVKILIVGPTGDVMEGWAEHYLIEKPEL